MFTEQLTNLTVRSKSPDFKFNKQNDFGSTLDLHFQICGAFLKKTGEKLHHKQADIIDKSSHILNLLQQSLKSIKKQTFYCSTNDSQYCPDQDFSVDSQEKIITRKSITRRSQTNINDALKQVEQMCSLSTISVLNMIVSQYSKIQAKIRNIQAKQHVIIKKQEAAAKYHQQNIILKKKLQAQSTRNLQLKSQLDSLKSKTQNISKCVQEKVNALAMNQKIVDINQKVYKDIKSFLQDKQIHINSRLRKIQHIQESIMTKIQTIIQEGAETQNQNTNPEVSNEVPCQRCCLLLKKLKQSILKYRNYLEHQAQQVQKLYNKHKKALFTFSSKGVASNKSLG